MLSQWKEKKSVIWCRHRADRIKWLDGLPACPPTYLHALFLCTHCVWPESSTRLGVHIAKTGKLVEQEWQRKMKPEFQFHLYLQQLALIHKASRKGYNQKEVEWCKRSNQSQHHYGFSTIIIIIVIHFISIAPFWSPRCFTELIENWQVLGSWEQTVLGSHAVLLAVTVAKHRVE